MAKASQQRMLAGFEEEAVETVAPRGELGKPEAKGTTEGSSRSTSTIGQGAESGERPDLTGKTVWVIDAHSLIYQVFHALPEMSGPNGQPVGAVFGFTRDVFAILDNQKPDYLICAFDHPGGTFRDELFAAYKADREEMPQELQPQIQDVVRVLDGMGVPAISTPNYEADDILATLAREVEEGGGSCYIVTADKDCRQLISDRVKIYNCRKNQVYDAASLQADWGVRPDQVVDFQALVGDKVDGVPGVPLIGPKNAQELLAKYGTLDAVLEAAPQLPPSKRRDNLIQFREQALMSRTLVKLDTHTPIALNWNGARVGPMNNAVLVDLFREFGFRSLAARVGGDLAAQTPPADDWKAAYHTIGSLDELRRLADEMAAHPRLSFDTETTNINPRAAQLVGLSFCWKPEEAWYVPVRAPAGELALPEAEVLEILRPVLENPAIAKVGQNLKYDMVVLRGVGVHVQGVAHDTMVADYLLQAGERTHNLDELARRYLNHENITIESLIGTGKNQKRMDEVPVALITNYAAEDALVAFRLAALLEEKLKQEQLEKLFGDVEVPLIDVLVELEFNGIRVDAARLGELSEKYTVKLAALEKEIYELAGHPFNIASPKQLAEVLFVEQKLPVQKKTKTGASTDAEVLEELAKLHALPRKIVEFRQYSKLKGTYVDALPELVNKTTGRVHTSFNQVVAATGRLSSNDPNLQNIPIRTEEGREIRSAFLPGEADWLLLAADYSQIELRILAHFSGDAALLGAFAAEQDIHTLVASQVFGVAADAVTSEMRRKAKAVNFGVIYGQSPFGLAKSLNIPQEEASRFIEAYFARYPGVDAFFQQLLEHCRKTGYVSTILGRRRAIQGVREPGERANSHQRSLPERTAINTVIQGSAADLIKLAMLRVHHRLLREQLPARMLLQIHDELVFEVAPASLAGLTALVREEMMGAMSLSVPLGVDVKFGPNWAACE